MSSSTRPALTDHERAQRRARERELTVRAVAQLRTSAGWQAWLRVRARTGLRRYSLAQPAADRAAGPRTRRASPGSGPGWRSATASARARHAGSASGRAASRPSKKLQAWRDAGADPATRPKAFYRLEAVFDRAQVDPLPAPGGPGAAGPADRADHRRHARLDAPRPRRRSPAVSASRSAGSDARAGHGRLVPAARAADRDQHGDGGQPAGRGAGARARARARPPRPPAPRTRRWTTRPRSWSPSRSRTTCAGFLGLDTCGELDPVPRGRGARTPTADAFERIAGLVDRLARRLEDALEPAAGDRTRPARGERRA